MATNTTKTTANANLAQSAMLAELKITGWSGRMFDKELTAEVTQSYQATADAARVNKALVSKEAMKAVRKAESDARATFRRFTLPWGEHGQRILPATAFHAFTQAMKDAEVAFEKEARAFLASYTAHVEEARIALGGMFREADYPSEEEMADRFTIKVEIKPLEEATDFRVNLSEDAVKRIKASIEASVNERAGLAMRNAFGRLHEVVQNMAERLEAYQPAKDDSKAKNVFRDSTVENVQKMVDLLPSLNLTNDPELKKKIKAVQNKLLIASADDLRADDAKRAKVAKDAKAIADSMADLM